MVHYTYHVPWPAHLKPATWSECLIVSYDHSLHTLLQELNGMFVQSNTDDLIILTNTVPVIDLPSFQVEGSFAHYTAVP